MRRRHVIALGPFIASIRAKPYQAQRARGEAFRIASVLVIYKGAVPRHISSGGEVDSEQLIMLAL